VEPLPLPRQDSESVGYMLVRLKARRLLAGSHPRLEDWVLREIDYQKFGIKVV
jgi:hypothetical protein